MSPISKNIKRLRGERGLTQEQLAEQLCVTRQTVSSWENNRTQPDIDMLTALSDALGADVEELIYGKRRSVGLEAPADDGDGMAVRAEHLRLVAARRESTGRVFFSPGVARKKPAVRD